MVFAGAGTDVDLEDGSISNPNGQEDLVPHDQSLLTVDLDCDPDTLNLQSKGKWITCYIEIEPFVGSIFVIEQANLSEVVVPIPTPEDGTSFYGYSSASSHTGHEAPLKSKIMVHRDTTTEELAIIIHHNIDRDESGIATGFGRVDFDLEGVPPSGFIPQSDDPSHAWDPPRDQEFSLLYPAMEGHWAYGDNTDGGVLDGLQSDENWSITINPLYWENIDDWEFDSGDGAAYELNMSLSVTISHFFVSRFVHDIDRSTVLFNSIVPPELDTKYGFVTDPDEYIVDHDNDSVPELKLKFSRDDVQDVLQASSPPVNVFIITGEFHDGTAFEGTDVNKVMHGG